VEQAVEHLSRWRSNIHLISQLIQNDVSSTKVRLFLKRGLSVRYLLPAPVVDYIEQRGLYQDGDAAGAAPTPRQEEKRDEDSVKGRDFGSSSSSGGAAPSAAAS
jgi:nicotinamide mononucleotide adenylyltransferase